jgi:8-oxo-dGTP pyrophosphatase MutT (NUDIX family)
MYIKIYFGEKPVFLCDEIDDTLHEYLHHPDTIFLDEVSGPAIKSLLHEIVKPDYQAGLLWHPNLESLKKAFWKHFTIIKAGGGLVENEAHEVLLIHRRGKWDLPKGKLDPGETIEQCALREVREETGLQAASLGAFIMTTYHTYNDYGHEVLKESYWYRMQAAASEQLVPQTIEDIHEIRWVARKDLAPFMTETFPSVRDVLKAG